MALSSPMSLILPTTEWTSACDEVGQQFGPRDELCCHLGLPTLNSFIENAAEQ